MMDLSNHGFFKAYLRSLSDKQLEKLEEWNTTRVAEAPSDSVADPIEKRRLIWAEQRRRRGSTGG